MCKKKLTFVFITTFSIFSLKSKFGIESLSSLVQDVFFRKKLNSTQNRPILTIRAVSKDMKTKKILQTIMFIVFWDFAMFDQIFLWLLLKKSIIYSSKYGICKLPHELLNNLWLRIWGNWEISRKSSNFMEL